MNTTSFDGTKTPEMDDKLKRMIENPDFLRDSVFPGDAYLFALGRALLKDELRRAGRERLLPEMEPAFQDACSLCLRAGGFVVWLFDFAASNKLVNPASRCSFDARLFPHPKNRQPMESQCERRF